MHNSFNARTTLSVNGKAYEIFSLRPLEEQYKVNRLPFALKIVV